MALNMREFDSRHRYLTLFMTVSIQSFVYDQLTATGSEQNTSECLENMELFSRSVIHSDTSSSRRPRASVSPVAIPLPTEG